MTSRRMNSDMVLAISPLGSHSAILKRIPCSGNSVRRPAGV